MHKIACSTDKYIVVVLYVHIYISSDIFMYVYDLSYLGSLGPRGVHNCESACKYESSTTCVDFETFHTLNIPFL